MTTKQGKGAGGGEPLSEEELTATLQRTLHRVLRRLALQKPLPPELVRAVAERLAACPSAGGRRLLLKNGCCSRRLEVVQALICEGFAQRHQSPERSLALAEAAVAAAEAFPARGLLRARVNDLRAEAWAKLGNARRLNELWGTAHRAFRRASSFAEQGSGDAGLAAVLPRLEAALLRDLCRFPEAAKLLRRAERRFRELGEAGEVARVQLARIRLHGEAGEPAEALKVAERLAPLPENEPNLRLGFLQQICWALVDLGLARQAVGWIRPLEALADEHAPAKLRLQVRWAIGRIFLEAGSPEGAAEALEEVCDAFTHQGLMRDAALSGLDLALAYLRARRHKDVRQLAQHLYPVFVHEQIPNEASAALLLFTKATDHYLVVPEQLVRTAREKLLAECRRRVALR